MFMGQSEGILASSGDFDTVSIKDVWNSARDISPRSILDIIVLGFESFVSYFLSLVVNDGIFVEAFSSITRIISSSSTKTAQRGVDIKTSSFSSSAIRKVGINF
jgi:hypothetical protein